MRVIIACIICVAVFSFLNVNNKAVKKEKSERTTVRWSDKEIDFVLPLEGTTNHICILTGLRSDGMFVWKIKPINIYDYK